MSRDDAGQGTVNAFAIKDSAISIVLNDDSETDHAAEPFHVDLIEEDGVVSPEERDFILTVPDFNELFNQLFNRLNANLLNASEDGDFDDAEIAAMDAVFLGSGFDEEYILTRDQEIAHADTFDPPAEIPLLAYLEESGLFAGLDAAPDPAVLIDDLYLNGGQIDLVSSYHDVAGAGIAIFIGDTVAIDLHHADINTAAGELNSVVLPNGRFFHVDSDIFELFDGTLRFDVGRGENAGTAYRIYQAAFARTPDDEGLAFWLDQVDRGASLDAVAEGFVASSEFASVYGTAATDRAFVERLYQNILDRDGEQAGIGFWTEVLAGGDADRALVLAGFSESFENVTGVTPAIAGGIFLPDELPEELPDELPDGPLQPLILTTGDDNLTGTPGDDTFLAPLDKGVATLGSDDIVTGGGGNDRIEAVLAGTGPINPALQGLGNIFLDMSGGGSFDASRTGNTTLWANSLNSSFTNVGEGTSIGIGSAASGTVTVSFSSPPQGSVKLDGASGATFTTPNSLDVLQFDVASASTLTVHAPNVTRITASGSSELHLTVQTSSVLKRITTEDLSGDFELTPFFSKVGFFSLFLGDGNDKVQVVAEQDTQSTEVFGKAGDDEIRTGISTDFIFAGDDDDIVASGPGADTIALGDGFDKAVFRSGDSDDSPTNLTMIVDYDTKEDKIDLGAFGATLMNGFRLIDMQRDIANLDPAATLRNALDIAEEYALLAEATHFTFQGNTYVYVDETHPNTGYSAGDFVVELIGEKRLVEVDFEF